MADALAASATTTNPYERVAAGPRSDGSTPVANGHRRSLSGFLGPAALVLGSLKLWSVAQDEIVVRDHPSDDPWYVAAADSWYWGAPYARAALVRQPAYPLWMAVTRSTGIPLRLAIELLVLAAAWALAVALVRAGLPRVSAALAFAGVAFHPFGYHINSFVVVDSLYAPLLVLSVAGMVALLRRPHDLRLAVVTGLALVLVWHTRQENALVAVYLVLVTGCAVWARRGNAGALQGDARRLLLVVLIVPGTIVAASSLALRLVNLGTYGVFAEYEFDRAGFQEAYRALLRVETGRPVENVAVPRETRIRLYEVSPAFRELRPWFEGPHGRRWTSFTEGGDAAGEISTGTFGWAFLDAVRRAGHAATAAESDAFYERLTTEIDAACRSATLPCRAVPLGPLEPDVARYAGRLPGSAWTLTRSLVWTGALPERRRADTIRPEYLAVADAVTNRRTALVRDELRISGWAADPTDAVVAVEFRGSEGTVLAKTDRLRSRPDLERHFRSRAGQEAPEPTPAAFDLTIPFTADRLPEGELVFLRRSGRAESVPLPQLTTMPLARLTRLGGRGEGLEYAIERRQGLDPGARPQRRFQAGVARVYGLGVLALLAAAAATLPARRLRTSNAGTRLLDAAFLLLVGIVAARLALLAVIDASSWPATGWRFAYPAALLVPCAALLLIHGNLRGLTAGRRPAWRR